MKTYILIAIGSVALATSAAHAQDRVTVSASFITQPPTSTFETNTSSSVNRETAQVTGRYEVTGGNGPDIGVRIRVWRMLVAGVSLTQVSRATAGDLRASYPHPFYFNRPREVSVDLADGDRSERAVHASLGVALSPLPRLTAHLFGGASFFQVEQPVSAALRVTETYPYDMIAATASSDSVSSSFTGFHVGADVAWYFTKNVGVGGVVRVTQGSRDVTVDGSAPFAIEAGGFQVGGGLRLRF